MRPTGSVRYMDDLGRICIPKELRKMACVKEGDPFEIFVEKYAIMLKLYHPEDRKIEGNLYEVIDELGTLHEYELRDEAEQLLKKINEKLFNEQGAIAPYSLVRRLTSNYVY